MSVVPLQKKSQAFVSTLAESICYLVLTISLLRLVFAFDQYVPEPLLPTYESIREVVLNTLTTVGLYQPTSAPPGGSSTCIFITLPSIILTHALLTS